MVPARSSSERERREISFQAFLESEELFSIKERERRENSVKAFLESEELVSIKERERRENSVKAFLEELVSSNEEKLLNSSLLAYKLQLRLWDTKSYGITIRIEKFQPSNNQEIGLSFSVNDMFDEWCLQAQERYLCSQINKWDASELFCNQSGRLFEKKWDIHFASKLLRTWWL
jgi:hypothetical protein